MALTWLAAFAADAAVVYKWTDADGVVHFSDQSVPGAERIVTAGMASHGISGGPAVSSGASSQRQPNTASAAGVPVIDSPTKDQVFFGDDTIAFHLRVEPPLQGSQTVTWHLNGKTLTDQTPTAISFSLQALPRGSYVVAATVADQSTGTAQTAESVNFFVKQPSELAPQHKRP